MCPFNKAGSPPTSLYASVGLMLPYAGLCVPGIEAYYDGYSRSLLLSSIALKFNLGHPLT